MGLDLDLATLAGMAGLGGSAIAGLTAAFFFRGLITRIISQIIFTTILSFVGFVALFHALGFTIVPPKLGYGDIGMPPDIPRMATLVFEVELVGLPPASPAGVR